MFSIYRRKKIVIYFAVSCLVFYPVLSLAQKNSLIEFGWDYPDVKMILQRIDSMQKTPFDGICFSIHRSIMEAFDTASKSENYFEYKKLGSIKWGRYKKNYIILRGFSKKGGHWFDDSSWVKIENNLAGLSKALKAGNLEGILFDPEYYYKDSIYNPWTYSASQYPEHSFKEVQAQVKKRGTQFINALQKHKSLFNFLSIWVASLIAEDMKTMPFEKTRQVLLISFIEGIIEGKGKYVTITDGNELAYWYKKPSQYMEAFSHNKNNAAKMMLSEKSTPGMALMPIAFPVYYDGVMGKVKGFNNPVNDEDGWKCLEETLKYSMLATDSIVWFYSERLNCWQGDSNDTLYSVISKIKNEMQNSGTKRKPESDYYPFKKSVSNINKGMGCYYLNNSKVPLQAGQPAFLFSINKKKNTITINFQDKIPVTVSVYENNRLLTEVTPSKETITTKTGKKKKKKLIVIAKYADKSEASAIQIQ